MVEIDWDKEWADYYDELEYLAMKKKEREGN